MPQLLSNLLPDPPDGVIFDFDGVMVDSLDTHLRAWRAATLGIFRQKLEEPERFIGLSTVAVGHMIAKECGDPSLGSAMVYYKKRYLSEHEETIKLLPGARHAVDLLTAAKTPFGIASNAPKKFIERLVSLHQLKVPVIVGREDVAHGKPHPDPYLLCARRLGLHGGQTMVFEDSVHGIEAAVRAGMIAVGLTTQTEGHTLVAAGAKATCKHLKDALDRGILALSL